MRDNLYIMAFLIGTFFMLLAGLSVTGVEIYQYTRAKDTNEASVTDSGNEQPDPETASEENAAQPDTEMDPENDS